MTRRTRLAWFVAFIIGTAPGCLALYSTRPVTITVVDPESDRPLANVPVKLQYEHVMVANAPLSQDGMTNEKGRVALPVADFDYGVILLRAGNSEFTLSPKDVREGAFFEKGYPHKTDTTLPEVAVELCPHPLDLWRMMGAPRKSVRPNPSLGLSYELPRCNYITDVRVCDAASGQVVWQLQQDRSERAKPFDHVNYGQVPRGMRETTTAQTLKKGERIRLEVTYQYDPNLEKALASTTFEFDVLGPNRFRRIAQAKQAAE
jgi:hypothetical protein